MASTGRSVEANSEAVRRLTAEVEQYRALMPRYEQVQAGAYTPSRFGST